MNAAPSHQKIPAKPKTDPINWDLARSLFVQGQMTDLEIMRQVGCGKSAYHLRKSKEDWEGTRQREELDAARSLPAIIEGSKFKWYTQAIKLFLKSADNMERMTMRPNLKEVEAWQRVFEKHVATGRTLFGLDQPSKPIAQTLVNVNVHSHEPPPPGTVIENLSENLSLSQANANAKTAPT